MAGFIDALLKIAPAALTYTGYKVKQKANEKADKERARVIQAMQNINTGAQQQLVDTTRNNVQQYIPERRMPALQEAEQSNIRRLTDDVTTAAPPAADGPIYAGRTSEAYKAASAKRAAEDLRYATRLARIMGRAAAPADTSLAEGFSNTNAALDRARIRSNRSGDLGVQNLELAQVEPSAGRYMLGEGMQLGGLMLDAYQGRPGAAAWGAR